MLRLTRAPVQPTLAPAAPSAAAQSCRHCGLPVPAEGRQREFCCSGCEVVHRLLLDNRLERFYELGGGKGQPVGAPPAGSAHPWLEEHLAKAPRAGGVAMLTLDVQGIRCAACVWVLQEVWRRQPGAVSIEINPALGQARLVWSHDQPTVTRWIEATTALGYDAAPASKTARPADRALLARFGICAALALNAMMFASASYAGLSPRDGATFELFAALQLVLATLALVIGGPVFFRAALAGLGQRVLHFDLPISIGLVLAYGASVAGFFSGHGAGYLDTVTVFVTLMLLGRWLQQRAVRRNRDYLLANHGAEHLRARRLGESGPELVPVTSIRPGDELLLAPGELVPVRGRLRQPGSFSFDWISGESEPRALEAGAPIEPGAFVAGSRRVRMVAEADARESGLLRLLATPPGDPEDLRGTGRFWPTLNRVYVAAVLAIAGVVGAVWALVAPERAASVVTALLVVTCPCAIGIATPLAFDVTLARLRRAGVFVRSHALLDKLRRVRTVAFDKTGTLTSGALQAQALREPAGRDLDVLWTMASQSSHPKSRAIVAALGACPTGIARAAAAPVDPAPPDRISTSHPNSTAIRSSEPGPTFTTQSRHLPSDRLLDHARPRFVAELTVEDVPGKGLLARESGCTWRLGSHAFVCGEDEGSGEGVTCLARDGHVVACFTFEEELVAGAAAELTALAARGLEVWLLSGDRSAKVRRAATLLGLPEARALGDLAPEQKARQIAALDCRDTLMVGDGINDGPAFAAAFTCGTPALDRPVMPSRADFCFTGAGAGRVERLFEVADRFWRVARTNLRLSLTYNLCAVALCAAGLMTPLLCAVLMPLSSLGLIAHTSLRLSRA